MFLQTNFNYQASARPPSPNFVSPSAHTGTFSPSRPPASCTSVSPQYHPSLSSHHNNHNHNPFRLRAVETNFEAQLALDAGGFSHFPQQQQTEQVRPQPKVKKIKGPKGYVSGFNFFAVSIRSSEEFKDELQNLTNNEINKVVGVKWKALPPAERAVFHAQAEDDKLRYLRDVHEHNLIHGEALVPKIDPPTGYDLSGQPLPGGHSDSGEQSSGSSRHTQRRGRKANHGKSGALRNASSLQRQRTSYSIFAHQEKDFLAGLKCPDLQRRMGKYLGSRWKNMPAAEKRMYDLLEASGATINKKPRV